MGVTELQGEKEFDRLEQKPLTEKEIAVQQLLGEAFKMDGTGANKTADELDYAKHPIAKAKDLDLPIVRIEDDKLQSKLTESERELKNRFKDPQEEIRKETMGKQLNGDQIRNPLGDGRMPYYPFPKGYPVPPVPMGASEQTKSLKN